jgi:hypothetical protein
MTIGELCRAWIADPNSVPLVDTAAIPDEPIECLRLALVLLDEAGVPAEAQAMICRTIAASTARGQR